MEDILIGENYKIIIKEVKDFTSSSINNIYDFLHDSQHFLEQTLSSEKLSRLALLHRSRLVTKLSSLIKEFENHQRERYTDTSPANKSFYYLSDASSSDNKSKSEPVRCSEGVYDVPYGEFVSDFDPPVPKNQCDKSPTTNPLQSAMEMKKKGFRDHFLTFRSRAINFASPSSLAIKAKQNRSPPEEDAKSRRTSKDSNDSNILYDDALTSKLPSEEELSYDDASSILKGSEKAEQIIDTNETSIKASDRGDLVYDDASKVNKEYESIAYETISSARELQKKGKNGISSLARTFSSSAIKAQQNRPPANQDGKSRRKNEDSDRLNDAYPLPPMSEELHYDKIVYVSTIPENSANVSQINIYETIVKTSEEEDVAYDDASKVGNTNREYESIAYETISERELQNDNNDNNGIFMNIGDSVYLTATSHQWYITASDAKAQALRYGCMERRLGQKLLSAWRHCYSVLLPSYLLMYDNDGDNRPQMVIDLTKPNIRFKYLVKLGVDCKIFKTHSFVLFHEDRVLYEMSTKSRDETEEWLMALHVEVMSCKK